MTLLCRCLLFYLVLVSFFSSLGSSDSVESWRMRTVATQFPCSPHAFSNTRHPLQSIGFPPTNRVCWLSEGFVRFTLGRIIPYFCYRYRSSSVTVGTGEVNISISFHNRGEIFFFDLRVAYAAEYPCRHITFSLSCWSGMNDDVFLLCGP